MNVMNHSDIDEIICFHWNTYGYNIQATHANDEYEIHYAKCSGQNFIIDDKIYPAVEQDLFIFDPTDLREVNAPDDALYEQYIISFKAEAARALSAAGTDLLECFDHRPAGFDRRLALSDENSAKFAALAARLYEASNAPEEYGRGVRLKLILGEILLLVNRLFQEKYRISETRDELQTSQHSMSYVTQYIDRHFSEEIRLTDIAAYCHLDKAYLCRLFKKTTGMCMTDYINCRRLSFAAVQLQQGGSVSDVARHCGFNSDAYFITMFKRTFGCTPKQYALAHPQPRGR